jgi:hypothetical protein
MVSLLLMLVLAAAGSFMGPANQARVAAQADSEQLALRVGTTAAVRGSSARVSFVRVSDDSRCPVGVTCFWEGDAIVHLRVEADGDSAVDLQLHANPRFSQAGRAGGLIVTLLGLEPMPRADEAIQADAYSATLQISLK